MTEKTTRIRRSTDTTGSFGTTKLMTMSCCCCCRRRRNKACYRYILYNKASCPVRPSGGVSHPTESPNRFLSSLPDFHKVVLCLSSRLPTRTSPRFFRNVERCLKPSSRLTEYQDDLPTPWEARGPSSWTEPLRPALSSFPSPIPSSFRPRSTLHLIPLELKPTYLPSSLHYPHQPPPYTLFL